MNTAKKISPAGDRIAGFFNPFRILSHLWQHRHLIGQLTRREIAAKYKGSFIGLGWSVVHPLLMLCVYTFVFSVVFKAKWGVSAAESRSEFAMTLFMGIITFNIFGDVVNAAPSLILNNINYVKKVVFPLEVLPLVTLLSVLTNILFSLGVLLTGILAFQHVLPWTVVLLPLAWLPMIFFSLGCAYFLASLGVFIRDMGATVGIVTTMLFFISPIFYPLSAVPENFRIICRTNLIAVFVEDARRVVLWGMLPDWPWYFGGLAVSLLVLILGFVWFLKSKRAFADVI